MIVSFGSNELGEVLVEQRHGKEGSHLLGSCNWENERNQRTRASQLRALFPAERISRGRVDLLQNVPVCPSDGVS